MSASPFDPTFDELPETIPVFPLPGVLLLPRARLPLNIFEPRYLAMIQDALASPTRLIGMVQPTGDGGRNPAVYPIGCAGRVSSFSETDDGRLLITLAGVSRFAIREELPLQPGGYRRVLADWTRFEDDLSEPSEEPKLDRKRLVDGLKAYFKQQGISANWDAIESTPSERLINSLAMICPFEPSEKQALVEARTLSDRAHMLTALVEMAVLGGVDGDSLPRQ